MRLRWWRGEIILAKDISVLPKELPGDDHFEGKSHEHIANTILEQIENGKSKLIGIEGKWGSGKSNILKIIEKKIKSSEHKESFFFFPYNAWLHQNDLHRRVIPTEIYEFIGAKKNGISNKQKYELSNILKILLGTVTETTINRIPRFSWGMILLVLEIIMFPVFNTVFGNAYEKDELSLCKYVLYMVCIALRPPILILGINIMKNIFIKKNKFCEACKQSLLELISIYKTTETTEIEDTSVTYTKEKNPTFSDFQKFLKILSSVIGDRKMIIVFDDIDRMQEENIQEFWGTMHNLFADNVYKNIFVIVPFAREQIKKIFKSLESDEYINKTFDVIYRVSLPILSDYTLFFKAKWEVAFGNIENFDQYNRVCQIFDKYSKNITPRSIIAFINEFVTNKQIFDETVPEEFIALFIMHKDTILENPQEKIMTLNFLGELKTFYEDTEEISKYLATLVFQVEPEKALDVVYKHSLKRALDNGSSPEIEVISNSKVFFPLVTGLLPELVNIDNAIICLDHVSIKMGNDPINKKQVWDDIFRITMRSIDDLPIDFNNVLPYQFAFIRNITHEQIHPYIFKLLQLFCKSEKFTSTGYFNIEKSLREELGKMSFDIDSVIKTLSSKKLTPEEYLNFLNTAKEKYEEVNLICPTNELDNFLMLKNITELGTLSPIKYLTEKIDLKNYKKQLNDLYKQYAADHSNLPIIIERLKDMEELINVSGLHPSVIFNMYNNIVKQKTDFIYDLIAMRLSVPQFQDVNFNNIFIEYLNNNERENDLVINTAKVIQNYIVFGDILINIKNMCKYPLYVNIVHYILRNNTGKRAHIVPVLQNFDIICDKARVDPQLLINNLERWLHWLKKEDGKYNFKETFSLLFVKEITESDTELAGYCIDQLKKYLDNGTKDEWKQSIPQNDSYEIDITMELDHSYNSFAVEAMHEILLELARNDVKSVDRGHYAKIINHMSSKGVNFTKTFNSVRDLLCQKGELNNEEFIFWSEWLFQYSRLDGKQEVLRTIFPVSLLDDDNCLDIIVENKKTLPKIIKSAEGESDGFIDGLKARLKKNPASSPLKEIAVVLNIKIPKNENEGETDIQQTP